MISSPKQNPNPSVKVKILRRDPNQTVSPGAPSSCEILSASVCETPPLESEGAYESARAKIFAEEVSHNSPILEELHGTKAKYRGHDNSAFDPDYCRVPSMVVVPPTVNGVPVPGVSPFPTLHQAYGGSLR